MQPRSLLQFALLLTTLPLAAQSTNRSTSIPNPDQIKHIVEQATDYQVHYMTHDGVYFRYRVHRIDSKEDTLRDLIESKDGTLGRLLQHNGQPLTADEDKTERDRLQKLLDSGDLSGKRKEQQHARAYGVELARAMPAAMLYTPTDGQPQLQNLDRPQLVLDFAPNPQFRPATTAQGLLSGLSGRLWIDSADHHIVRMEVHAQRNLDLAMGILVRVYSGGTIEYDQRRIAENQYAYTHVRMHLRLRELMFRTVPYESDLTAFEIKPLTEQPSGPDAIRSLLSDNVKTR